MTLSAAELPGTLWFVHDGVLRRMARGQRHDVAADSPLFPSRFALPDGRLVAIASRGDGSPESEQLALVAADGRVTRVGPRAPLVRSPAVERGGTSIVVEANIDGHSELYRIDVATGTPTRLTDNKQGNFAPVAFEDDIVFESSRDGNIELYRLATQQRLTAFHKDDWGALPSPDNRTIIFSSDREGPVRLFAMAPDGTGQRRLTTRAADEGDELEPAWSPDGTRVAYVVETKRERTVRVRDLASGEERIVSPAGARDADPCFSPDGAWVVVARESFKPTEPGVVWAVRLVDGAAIAVAKGRLPRWQ
jgi:TolB protein